MKLFCITLCVLVFSRAGISQELAGKWEWHNENLSGEVFFGEGTYFIKVYLQDSDIKISESFMYVKQLSDTLVFSLLNFETEPTELRYYVIKKLTDGQLELLDVSTGEIDSYINVDHKQYRLSKFQINHFQYDGAIACVSSDDQEGYNSCLNFKSVSILSSIEEIEETLGEPYSIINQGGTDYRIYLLPSDLKPPPYLAVSINEQNELSTIQLSGTKSSDNFSFSGIRLGDYYTMVENKLGKPTSVKQLDEQTELWTYDPHSISVEIKNEFVISIKLRRV